MLRRPRFVGYEMKMSRSSSAIYGLHVSLLCPLDPHHGISDKYQTTGLPITYVRTKKSQNPHFKYLRNPISEKLWIFALERAKTWLKMKSFSMSSQHVIE